MGLAGAALAVLVIAAVGCGNEDADSLASNDERAVRTLFASHGFKEGDATCLIGALTERIGAEQVADFAHGRLNGREENEIGTELVNSMVECEAKNPEYTVCYGLFNSRADARHAAEMAKSVGFDDADVGIGGNPPRRPIPAVDFLSGKTDAAARQIQNRFPDFIEHMGGKLGHPGSGCLERPFFGA